MIGQPEYSRLVKALFPTGVALDPRNPETRISAVADAIADELARIDSRVTDLLNEFDPVTTNELLPDWERVLGLPEDCVTEAQSTEVRRRAVVSKLTNLGGQSRAYFIALAAALGYEITIEEFRPFRCGFSASGDPLSNGDWVHAWRVVGPEVNIIPFRSGVSVCGDPLASWGNVELECVINEKKPAHTRVLFVYRSEQIDYGTIGFGATVSLDYGSIADTATEYFDYEDVE